MLTLVLMVDSATLDSFRMGLLEAEAASSSTPPLPDLLEPYFSFKRAREAASSLLFPGVYVNSGEAMVPLPLSSDAFTVTIASMDPDAIEEDEDEDTYEVS